MIPKRDGERVLQKLEDLQLHDHHKMLKVKQMSGSMPQDSSNAEMTLELALTRRMRQVFPDLPDEIMAKLIPQLETLDANQLGSLVPWNRRKRRRLQRAKSIVLHVFAGESHSWWENSVPMHRLKFSVWTLWVAFGPICWTRMSTPSFSVWQQVENCESYLEDLHVAP